MCRCRNEAGFGGGGTLAGWGDRLLACRRERGADRRSLMGTALSVRLGGLNLTIRGWRHADIRALRSELRDELHALVDRVTALERGEAYIEGMLKGASLFHAAELSEALCG